MPLISARGAFELCHIGFPFSFFGIFRGVTLVSAMTDRDMHYLLKDTPNRVVYKIKLGIHDVSDSGMLLLYVPGATTGLLTLAAAIAAAAAASNATAVTAIVAAVAMLSASAITTPHNPIVFDVDDFSDGEPIMQE